MQKYKNRDIEKQKNVKMISLFNKISLCSGQFIENI